MDCLRFASGNKGHTVSWQSPEACAAVDIDRLPT